jgi:hypothetical protein
VIAAQIRGARQATQNPGLDADAAVDAVLVFRTPTSITFPEPSKSGCSACLRNRFSGSEEPHPCSW